MNLTATPWEESGGFCDCCGNESKTIWGDVSDSAQTVAIYYVQWTINSPDHWPNVDLILGPWGEGANTEERFLVSLVFQPGRDGGAFMVTDGAGRPSDTRELCGRALRREEVVGTTLADEVFKIVDTVWFYDSRISEVKALNDEA